MDIGIHRDCGSEHRACPGSSHVVLGGRQDSEVGHGCGGTDMRSHPNQSCVLVLTLSEQGKKAKGGRGMSVIPVLRRL